jgi:hypothetical protein
MVGAIRRAIDQGLQGGEARFGQVFIGIENQNPSASGGFETFIPCGAEVVAPRKIYNPRPAPLRDVCSFVRGARIHYNHFTGEPLNGIQASGYAGRFIFRDQDERQWEIRRLGHQRKVGGFEKNYKSAQNFSKGGIIACR